MANPYAFVGDPEDVKIVGFGDGNNKAIYAFTTHGFMSQMMSAPSTDDLFPPSSAEPKNERDKNISDLLFRAAKDDKLPSNTRLRQAYGFNVPGVDGRVLLRLYRSLLQQHRIHSMMLDHWRISASMQENIRKKTSVDPKLLLVLQYLDTSMKESAERWYKYEQLLRSRMRTSYPACINCGGKGNDDQKLLKCGRCLNVQYCNQDCQQADWKVHKAACKK